MIDERREHLIKFYSVLKTLEGNTSGKRVLSNCDGRMGWPKRGVYFFFEPGEMRDHTGDGPRVVRVGTHALTYTSKTKLWNRLSQHRGTKKPQGGNHRGSIFRLIVGASILAARSQSHTTWGKGSSAPRDIREHEIELETQVSTTIGAMPFLWLEVDSSEKGPEERSIIERNSISLLSNYGKSQLDPPSPNWLGRKCNREKVRTSGLWNSNHVNENYDPAFLDLLERKVIAMGASK